MEDKIMGSVKVIRLKTDCVRSKFEIQSEESMMTRRKKTHGRHYPDISKSQSDHRGMEPGDLDEMHLSGNSVFVNVNEPPQEIQVEVKCEPQLEVKSETEDVDWLAHSRKGSTVTGGPTRGGAEVKLEPRQTADDILVPFQLFEGQQQNTITPLIDGSKYTNCGTKCNMVEINIKQETVEPTLKKPDDQAKPPECSSLIDWQTLEEKVAATVAAIGEEVAAMNKSAADAGQGGSPGTRAGEGRQTRSKSSVKVNGDPRVKRITPLFKHLSNLKEILAHSNATLIKTRGDLGYECGYCDDKFPEPSDLKVHVLKSHKGVEGAKSLGRANGNCFMAKVDITGLQCNLCGNSMNSLEDLLEHLQTHSIRIFTEIKSQMIPFKFETDDLQCCICMKVVNTFRNLFTHVMHTHYRNFICEDCDAGFINRDRLLTHRTVHKTGTFECQYCGKVFNTVIKKQYHERNLHNSSLKAQKSKCSYCNERFRDSTQKDRHLAEMHGVKLPTYICKSCDTEFPTQNALNIHTRRDHLEERKYVCTVCGKGFFVKAGLTLHMVKHTGSKEFQCPVCEKSYGRRRTLVVHMRIHTNDRRHMCEHCGMAFVQKSHWRGHMRSQHGQIV